MVRNISSILVPPMAVCRYGCAGCCAAPIATVWIAGIVLLGFHFFGSPHLNELVEIGSLFFGIAAIATSIMWARLTLAQVDRDGCKETNKRSSLCKIIPPSYDNDPLEDVERMKHL
ncbi:MAG: hypothetical protein ACWA5X_09820 [bacterium]